MGFVDYPLILWLDNSKSLRAILNFAPLIGEQTSGKSRYRLAEELIFRFFEIERMIRFYLPAI